jgi:hypothetical protein
MPMSVKREKAANFEGREGLNPAENNARHWMNRPTQFLSLYKSFGTPGFDWVTPIGGGCHFGLPAAEGVTSPNKDFSIRCCASSEPREAIVIMKIKEESDVTVAAPAGSRASATVGATCG